MSLSSLIPSPAFAPSDRVVSLHRLKNYLVVYPAATDHRPIVSRARGETNRSGPHRKGFPPPPPPPPLPPPLGSCVIYRIVNTRIVELSFLFFSFLFCFRESLELEKSKICNLVGRVCKLSNLFMSQHINFGPFPPLEARNLRAIRRVWNSETWRLVGF